MPTVVCLGEALVDFVASAPDVDLIQCPGFRKAPGGAPGNVAAGLAKLGVDVAFLGKVGEDPFGHFLEQSYAGAGVETRWMRFDAEARTGLAFVSLKSDGERDFLFYRNPSADMRYTPEEVRAVAGEVLDCRVYHFGSISLIDEPVRSATLEALRLARERGAIISFDPNLRPPLWPDLETARREILAALPRADLVKVSEEEGEFLFGIGSPAAVASEILEYSPSLVAVTLGAGGCFLATRSASLAVPGFPVQTVDTTGAGDGFVAGMLARLLEAAAGPTSLAELAPGALREIGGYSNAVGALTTTHYGAIPALPEREAVERFLSGR